MYLLARYCSVVTRYSTRTGLVLEKATRYISTAQVLTARHLGQLLGVHGATSYTAPEAQAVRYNTLLLLFLLLVMLMFLLLVILLFPIQPLPLL